MKLIFEVGTLNKDQEWDTTLLENATYNEAYQFCRNYKGNDILWIYNENTEYEFYQNGKQIRLENVGIILE